MPVDIATLVGQARTLLATGTPDAVDQAASMLEVVLDQAASSAPSTVTPTPATTATPSTLTAAAISPGTPPPPASGGTQAAAFKTPDTGGAPPPGANVPNSTPGEVSTTGDNSASAPSADTRKPAASVPTSATTATKGVDTMPDAPAINDGVPAVNAGGAPTLYFDNGDERIKSKLPQFMNALLNGGKKAIHKAFQVADSDQQFFDELYTASLHHVLDEGKINVGTMHNAEMSKGIVFGSKGFGAGDEDELRKGVSSSFAPGIYLQRLVKLMLPVVTPFRNRVYTEQAPLGAATAQWRTQLGYTNFIYAAAMSVAEASVALGSTTGTGQVINESSLTFAVPFVSTPNSNVVSLQAVAAGRGYDDPLQIAVIQSLTAMLKTEECNLLYGSNGSIAGPASVTSGSAASGSISAGSYTIKVSALTGQGWRYTQDIPSYNGSGSYSVGGVTFTTAGESAVTASGSFFTAGSAKITASWPAVPGAVAYNVYLTVSGSVSGWQQTVTWNNITWSTLPVAVGSGSAGPGANTTANANGYEGLVSWAELSTIYGQAIPKKSFTDQGGVALTLNGANSIKEWDAILKQLWVNWNIAPTLILCSPQAALHANAVVTSGSAGFPAYRIEAQNVQGQIVGGLMQTGYINKMAPWAENLPRIVDILAHPYMSDGSYLFLSESINYRMARETRGFKLETRIPYTYFPLGPQAPNYPFTVLVDEALECYHAGAQAAVAGVFDQ